jgi:hypothetical protein
LGTKGCNYPQYLADLCTKQTGTNGQWAGPYPHVVGTSKENQKLL